MPGIVKIGVTDGETIEARLMQLSSPTGVPLPFECYFAAKVDDANDVEKKLHQIFFEQRVNPKREFFRLDPEKAVLAISIGKFDDVTPGDVTIDQEEKEALEKAKSRRPRINLAKIGIKAGDVLTFSRDDSKTATVVPDGKLNLDGEIMSLSSAALKVLQSMGYKSTSVSGTDNWMFDGKLLDERRRQMEVEQFEDVKAL